MIRAVRAVAIGASAMFAVAVALVATRTPAAMDFIAQYSAARLVAEGHGALVLDPAAVLAAEHAAAPDRTALLPFVQPPAIALLLASLAALPFETAFVVMASIDFVLMTLAVLALRPRGAAMALGVLVAPPAVVAVAHGQTTPLVLLLIGVALRAGGPAGGVALGLTLLRPQTAPLLLLAGILDPRRRLATLAGALLVIAMSAVVVGIDGLARYAALLADASLWSVSGELGLARAIGWSGIAVPLGIGAASLVLAILGLAGGAVAVSRADPARRPLVAAAWSLVASPHALMHDGVLLYPAILALATTRAPWESAAILVWLEHLIAVPLAPIWSLAASIRATYAREPS